MISNRVRTYTPSITPFAADLSVDEASLAAHVARLAEAGTGIILTSTLSGEAHSLDLDEHRRAYDVAVRVCRGRVPVCAAIRESTNTRDVQAIVREAVGARVDSVLLNQCRSRADDALTEQEQERYWSEVLEFASVPAFLSLDTSASGGYYASPQLVGRLADRYQHVIGVCLYLRGGRATAGILGWEPSAPFRGYRACLPERVQLISQVEALQQGAEAIIQAAGNVLPATLQALVAAWNGGNVAEFAEAKQRWERWIVAAEIRWGGSIESARVLKAILRERGLESGSPRPPLLPATMRTGPLPLREIPIAEWETPVARQPN